MTQPTVPQVWYRCTTCDVRYLSRSPESNNHGKPDCKIVYEGPKK